MAWWVKGYGRHIEQILRSRKGGWEEGVGEKVKPDLDNLMDQLWKHSIAQGTHIFPTSIYAMLFTRHESEEYSAG